MNILYKIFSITLIIFIPHYAIANNVSDTESEYNNTLHGNVYLKWDYVGSTTVAIHFSSEPYTTTLNLDHDGLKYGDGRIAPPIKYDLTRIGSKYNEFTYDGKNITGVSIGTYRDTSLSIIHTNKVMAGVATYETSLDMSNRPSIDYKMMGGIDLFSRDEPEINKIKTSCARGKNGAYMYTRKQQDENDLDSFVIVFSQSTQEYYESENSECIDIYTDIVSGENASEVSYDYGSNVYIGDIDKLIVLKDISSSNTNNNYTFRIGDFDHDTIMKFLATPHQMDELQPPYSVNAHLNVNKVDIRPRMLLSFDDIGIDMIDFVDVGESSDSLYRSDYITESVYNSTRYLEYKASLNTWEKIPLLATRDDGYADLGCITDFNSINGNDNLNYIYMVKSFLNDDSSRLEIHLSETTGPYSFNECNGLDRASDTVNP
ncbi:hypothetical protein V9N52_004284 [Vibrio navarrensis]